MNFKFKNKKIIIFALIIILILIIGGLFWWWEERGKEYGKTISEREFVDSKYFTVEDTPEGTIVENKKEGLSVKVPEGWSIKEEGDGISFCSPEVKFDEKGSLIFQSIKEGGCGVTVQIIKCKKVDPELTTDAEDLINYIIAVKDGSYKEEDRQLEILEISGKEGLKRSYIKDGMISKISVEIPLSQTIYSFDSGFIFSEKCTAEFNKFLETVSIIK